MKRVAMRRCGDVRVRPWRGSKTPSGASERLAARLGRHPREGRIGEGGKEEGKGHNMRG